MPFTTVFANILQTPHIVSTLIRNVKRQEGFISKHIQPQLEEAEKSNDGTLDPSDYRKIKSYYGLAVPAILGEAIAVLRGFDLTTRERFALTYLGCITGLFDDFFDKHSMDDQRIKTLLENPEDLQPGNSGESLFIHFYKKALQESHDPQKLLHYFCKVYKAQIDSKKQTGPGLSDEEIYRITIHKGAVSVLFYRAALSHPFLENEENAFYQMGGLMQFGNDIFDIWKDRDSGIHTLLTTTDHIDKVRKTFISTMNRSFDSFLDLGYERKNIKKFLQLISLCLCSRCFVCLDQLESNEKNTGNIFKPEVYSRQQLVCDMEKNINKWRTLRYHMKHHIKLPRARKLS